MNVLWCRGDQKPSAMSVSDQYSSGSSRKSRNSRESRNSRTRTPWPRARRCYLCGAEGPMRHIDDVYLCDGREERYDKMLEECFSITIAHRNSMICPSCVRRLRSANRFRTEIERNMHAHNTVGDHVVDSSDSRIPERLLNQKNGILNMFSLIKSESLPAKPNPKLLELLRVTLEAQLKHKKDNTSKQQGDTFSKRASSIDSQKCKLNNKYDLAAPKKRIIRREIPCSVCNNSVSIITPVSKDINTEEVMCPRCKAKSKQTCMCKKCNLIIPLSTLQAHLALHSKAKLSRRSVSFNLGNGVEKRTRSPIKHRRLQKRYQCQYCEKNFALAQNLASHMSARHGDIPHCMCTICGRVLGNKRLLDRHMQSHAGKPLFECDTCSKVLKTKKALYSHEIKAHK